MFSLIRKHRIFGLVLALVFATGLTISSEAYAENSSPLTKEEETIFSQNQIVFYEPCSDAGGSDSLSGEVTISGNTAEEKVWSGLRSFLTAEQAAGVMGNIKYEDGNYGPVRREGGKSGDIWNSGTQMGMGLVQWSFGRRVKLLNYVKSQDAEMIIYFEDETLGSMSGDDFIDKYGHKTANRLYQLELQYLKRELDTVPSYHGIYNQRTVTSAADFFLEHVEIPANIAGQRPLRRATAQEMYDKYGSKTFTSNGESSSTVGVADSTVTSNINDKAWELADQTREESAKGPTEAYLKAQKSVKCPGDCYKNGESCDRFVAVVVRAAGVDDNIPWGNVATQEDYMIATPKIYTRVEGDATKEATYQPGDIRVKIVGGVRKHIEIYGQRDGKGYILSASNDERWAGYTDFFAESGAEYHIYRTQGTPKCVTSSCQQNTMDVNSTAVCLAWPLGTKDSKKLYHGGKPTEAFKIAIDKVFPKRDWARQTNAGASCDVGAATVVRYSGVDKSFPRGLDEQFALASKGDSKKWNVIRTTSKSALKPGDVVLKSGHVWIYVEDQNGKKYRVDAHHNWKGGMYLGIEDSLDSVMIILRAKNAKNSTSGVVIEKGKSSVGGDTVSGGGNSSSDGAESTAVSSNAENCDRCQSTNSDTGLKEGGMTLAEAKAWMETYRQEASKKKTGSYMFKSAYVLDAGCGGGTLNNCVAFSQWFLNKYTSIGPKWANTVNGNLMVKHLGATKGLKTGNEPRPYAVFSTDTYNHTGVVMGVTSSNVVVCEASCSNGYTSYWPGCSEWSLDTTKAKGMTYAYTDDIMNSTGGGGGSW